jgi:hypothetical protein
MAAVYYEFIIKGDEKKVCAYLDGFFRGRGVREGYFLSKDHPVRVHALKEFVEFRGEVVHLICASKLRTMVYTAVRVAQPKYDFEIRRIEQIRKASFHFKFETASRVEAGKIKRILSGRPAGVKLVDYEPSEIRMPEAEGPEAYAPLHPYTFSGEGLIEGDFDSVLRARRRLSADDFIHCEDVQLHY